MTPVTRRRLLAAASTMVATGLAGCEGNVEFGDNNSTATTQPPPHTITEPVGDATVLPSLGVPLLTDAYTITVRATQTLDGQELDELVITFPETFSLSGSLTYDDVAVRVGGPGSPTRQANINDVRVGSDGTTLTLSPGSSVTLTATDTIVVEFRGVSAPVRTGEYLVGVEVNGAVSDSGAVTIASDFTPRESTFETTTEGWTVVGDVQDGSVFPDRKSGDGDTGSYLSAEDDTTGDVWYWVAPRSFRGSKSPYIGGTLSFSLRQSTTEDQFDAADVVLASDEQVLYHDFGDETAHPGTDWTRYDVPLTPDAWLQETEAGGVSDVPDDGRLDRSEPADRETFESVLGSVETLHIRGEYVDGSDVGDIDSVALTPGPGDEEPTETGS
ncbi:laminin B domain-containing protein [Haloarchaeobius sp. DYHT-AS-18]|uniref:laminin B domain-containing protein n=1 Tax=Haloarchaeobius sp. DYHT-AS-18 TaxID=3446117 RepID=UPI003EBF5E7C